METGFVTYQPGGTATDTTFTDFGSLTSYIQSVGTSVQAWTIYVDGYFSDYNVVIMGTYSLPTNVTFVGVYGSIQSDDELTTFLQLGGGNVSNPSQDCVFDPFPTNLSFVNILPYSINVASPLVTVDGSIIPQLVLSLQASALVNDGVGAITTPMISGINGSDIIMSASNVSYFYTMQNPVVFVDAASTASLTLCDFGAIYGNPFSGVTARSIGLYIESSNYLDPSFLSNSAIAFHFDSVAPQVAYTPSNSSNWTLPNPTTVQAALDDLAANDLVTWADDLAGSTNTAQYVASISGDAGVGGTIPINATTLAFASGQVSPAINQAALVVGRSPGVSGQNLTVQAQAGQNVVGSHIPINGGNGGNLVLTSGVKGTSNNGAQGSPGTVSLQIGGTTFLNIGATGNVTLESLGSGVVQSSATGLLSSGLVSLTSLSTGASNQVLVMNGSMPSWQNLTLGGSFISGQLPTADLVPGASAQLLVTNGSMATWETLSGDASVNASAVMTNTGLQGITVPSPSGTGTTLTYNAGAFSWTTPSFSVPLGYATLYGASPQSTLTTSGTYYQFGTGTGSVAWISDGSNLTTSATGFSIPSVVIDGYYLISFNVSVEMPAADRLTFKIYRNGSAVGHTSFASNGGTATQAVSVSGQIVTFANVGDAFALQVAGSVNNLSPTWLYSTFTAVLV